jgi:hypothetical protein
LILVNGVEKKYININIFYRRNKMSHPMRDCGEAHRELGITLNDFLYEDGKPMRKGGVRGVKKEHTYEELWEMLETIRENSWDSYNQIADYMGWQNDF